MSFRKSVSAGFLLAVFAIVGSIFIFSRSIGAQVAPQEYERIIVQGDDSAGGFYDPSVEYGNDNVGWLAYSGSGPSFQKLTVDTHLAKTINGGKTWVKVNDIQTSRDETIVRKGLFWGTEEIEVRRRHETPTLLYDISDPNPERRWKLFWATGFADLSFGPGEIEKATLWKFIQIGYKYASSPEKLAQAEEIHLFGSSELDDCLSESCRVKFTLNDFHPDLGNSAFYMEPGSLLKDGVIYLTLSAVSKGELQKTILIASKDYGETWEYLGALTTKNDILPNTPPEQSLLTSSALVEENGKIFLLVSPRGTVVKLKGYSGVYVFEFEDIARARLKRDLGGKLIVYKYLPPISSALVGGGQSEYHSKNTYGGIIMSQTDNAKLGTGDFFQIYSAKEKIADFSGVAPTPTPPPAGQVVVNGYAWSDNVGWIEFNPSSGGVFYDKTTGALSGYAWSDNIGWIKFENLSAYPSGVGGTAAKADSPASIVSSTVSGWARACAGTESGDCNSMVSRTDGWDGWIKFDTGKNNPVSINLDPESKDYGDFSGYAWGSDVVGWVSFNCSDTGVCGISNHKVKALLRPPTPPVPYLLSVTKSGTGAGTVASNPSGVNCGAACSASYNEGTSVALTASADAGSVFIGWTGACSGSGSCAVAMSAAKSVNAEFRLDTVSSYNITFNTSGDGSGNAAMYSYDTGLGWVGEVVISNGYEGELSRDKKYKFVPSASSGSSFSGWSGSCSSIGANNCLLEKNPYPGADKTITAMFTLDICSSCGGGDSVIAHISARETVVKEGYSTVVNWTSENAASCFQSDGDSDTGWEGANDTTSGSYETASFSSFEGSRTYTINCVNGSQTDSASVTIDVGDNPEPPSIEMWADPQNIGYDETSLIKWLSSNVLPNCVLYLPSGDSLNVENNNMTGKTTGKLTSDATYEIKCVGSGSSASDVEAQTTVIVDLPPPPPASFTLTTNPPGASLLATIVDKLPANSNSIDLILSTESETALDIALSGVSSPGGAVQFTPAPASISVIKDYPKTVKIKAINIPGATTAGNYTVTITAKDTGDGGETVSLEINLKVETIISGWGEY